ncbi:MAG: carboxypeptidase regulatory-like domain-containing protein [Terriglobia bacterium]
MRRLFQFLGVAAICFLLARPAPAQSLFASLSGTVVDSSGAVIPGADVTVKNSDSGTARKVETNQYGYFSLTEVPTGTYEVSVFLKGFEKWVGTGIALSGGDSRTMNITLKVSSSTTTVQVIEKVTGVATVDTGDKTSVISSSDLQNLSLVSRNATEFLKILPGAAMMPNGGVNKAAYIGETIGINGSSIAGNTGGLSAVTINGQSVDITQDGQHVFDPGASGAATPINPNPDMISEVKVLNASFSADNAKGPIVVNTVTKGGGNAFHGAGYMYARNSAMNANDSFNNAVGAAKPASSYYYPGGNIGGPLIIPKTGFNKSRQKLFFFEAYENYHQLLDGGVDRDFIPTSAMMQGDFSALSTYGSSVGRPTLGVVPTSPPLTGGSSWLGFNQRAAAGCTIAGGKLSSQCISPSAAALLGAFLPKPTNDNPQDHQGFNYIQSFSVPQNSYQNVVRGDWNISDNTKVYVTWSRQREVQNQPLGLWAGSGSDWAVPDATNVVGGNGSDFVTVSLVHIFSPTMTSETKYGYTKINFPNAPADPTKLLRADLPGFSLKGIYGNPTVPDLTSWNNSIPNLGGSNLGADFHPTMICYKGIPSVTENLTKVIGTHTTKYGFYFEHVYNRQDNWGQYMGVFYYQQWSSPTGNNYSDALMGIGQGSYTEAALPPPSTLAQNDTDFYAQDDWKVSRRLTIQYGIRFEHYAKPYDGDGIGMAVFNPSLYQSDPKQFALNETNTGIVWNKIDKSIPLSGASSQFLFFSPRLGAAYDLFGTGKTILRGGWGKYRAYDSVQSNNYTGPVDTALGSVGWSCGGNDPLCPTWEAIDTHAQPVPTFGNAQIGAASGVTVYNPNDHQQPLITNYVFSIDQRLPGQFLVEASYVGNHSDFLQVQPNINAVPVGGLFKLSCDITTAGCQNTARPYQNFGTMSESLTAGIARYDSLQVSLLRNIGFLSLNANYTWSKALGDFGNFPTGTMGDYGQNFYYGASPNERAKVLNLSYVFNLPHTNQGNKLTRGFVNGWQISGITTLQSGANETSQSWNLNYSQANLTHTVTNPDGTTSTITDKYFDNIHLLGTGDFTQQPTITCNPKKGLTLPHEYLNPNCFAPATANGGFGTGGMPYLAGPMFWQSDLSLMKNFRISERQNLQFRFAAFNFLNHDLPSFTSGDSDLHATFDAQGQLANNPLTATTKLTNPFGIAQYAFGHRIMEMGIKYTF